MTLMKRSPKLLALSAGVLLLNGANPRGAVHARATAHGSATDIAETTQAKIARAMSAEPADVANSATIIDTDAHGKMFVLREGKNGFTCMPGNPKAVGDPPMGIADQAKNAKEVYATHERLECLRRAILRLTPSLRNVIEIHHAHDSSLKEVAEFAGISVAATKSRLYRAKKTLRRAFEGKQSITL